MFAAAAVPPSGLRRAPKRGRHPGEPLGYCAEASVGVGNRKLWVTSCNVCVTLNSIFNNSRVCCRLKHSLRYNPDSKEERVSTCDVERSRSRCRGEGCSAACQTAGQRVRLRRDCSPRVLPVWTAACGRVRNPAETCPWGTAPQCVITCTA